MVLLVCNKEGDNVYRQLGELTGGNYELATSEKELTNFIETTKDTDSIKNCFILADLTWGNRPNTSHYGFEVAKKLRLSRLRCVFYFITFTPPRPNNLKESKYALLRTSAYHEILNIQDIKEKAENLSGELMSKELLEDIGETLVAPQSLVREILHDLKNKVILKTGLSESEVAEKLREATDTIFHELELVVPDKKDELFEIKRELSSKLSAEVELNGVGATIKVVEDFTNKIVNLAPESNIDEDTPEDLPSTRWKVLFVDDEKSARERFEEGFINNNIAYSLSDNVEDALKQLQSDLKKNLFTVLVTDIRFKNQIDNKWDKLQGYDLLSIVSQQLPNYISKFAITAARKRLYRLKKGYQFLIHAYYKDDVQSSSGAMNMFCQKIREEGDNTYYKSRSRPQLSVWTKGNSSRFPIPLGQYYREHLFSIDYSSIEDEINEKAKEYVDIVLADKLGNLEDIEFTGTIKAKSPSDLEGLYKFRFRTLVGRRIALALYLHHKEEEEIFRYMQPKADVTDLDSSKKLLFNSSLALSFKKDLPSQNDVKAGMYLKSNLLEEEISWLVKEYKFDFDLDKIRLHKKELDTIIIILGDYQHELKSKTTDNQQIAKLQEAFIKENLEKISTIKKAINLFDNLNKLALHYGFQQSMYSMVKEDLVFIENTQLKAHLEKMVS